MGEGGGWGANASYQLNLVSFVSFQLVAII